MRSESRRVRGEHNSMPQELASTQELSFWASLPFEACVLSPILSPPGNPSASLDSCWTAIKHWISIHILRNQATAPSTHINYTIEVVLRVFSNSSECFQSSDQNLLWRLWCLWWIWYTRNLSCRFNVAFRPQKMGRLKMLALVFVETNEIKTIMHLCPFLIVDNRYHEYANENRPRTDIFCVGFVCGSY